MAEAGPRRPRFSARVPLIYVVLLGYLVVVVYPMLWLLYSSVKPDKELFLEPFKLPAVTQENWDEFATVWPDGAAGVLLSIGVLAVMGGIAYGIAYGIWRTLFRGQRRSVLYGLVAAVLVGELLFTYAFAHTHWMNFTNAWTKGEFGGNFMNSVILTVSTVTLVLLFSSMAAYALSRFVFPGSRPLFFYFLGGLMIPLQLAIVPLFFQMKDFGMLNSRWGLLTVYVAFGMPFSIFILTGFFRSLPTELYESALIDGASEVRAFWSIMLPLARPGLITVAIFSFLGTWNEFFMAFMFLSGQGSENIRTLPLGLANITIVSQYRSDWGMAFAGLVLLMLPTLLVYSLLQKHLSKGITMGALKG